MTKMSILSELKRIGIDVTKTDNFFRGLRKTEVGYTISRKPSMCEKSIYFLKRSESGVYPCNDQTLYVVFGTEYEDEISTREDAERLAAEGEIFSFKSSDLYAEYYNFAEDRDLECCFKYGYSAKSREYIESIMEEIGLIKYTQEDNQSLQYVTKDNVIKVYDIIISAKTYVGKVEDMWIAQTSFQVLDDITTIRFFFNRMPSEEDIRTAFTIKKFDEDPIEVFKCYECGHLTHWLDLPGDIADKRHMAEERYCGC